MKCYPNMFFWAGPTLVDQSSAAGSSLQIASKREGKQGYADAVRSMQTMTLQACRKQARKKLPQKYKNALGPQRRGTRKIKKSALSNARRAVGRKGGNVRAGGTSSAKVVQAKERSMVRCWKQTGKWPTRNRSRDTWTVSTELWARVRKDHRQDRI